jgi:hypothetical protein
MHLYYVAMHAHSTLRSVDHALNLSSQAREIKNYRRQNATVEISSDTLVTPNDVTTDACCGALHGPGGPRAEPKSLELSNGPGRAGP